MVSCGVGHRHGLDPELLWLCYRLAAVALTGALVWELPYAAGVALKSKKTKKQKIKTKQPSLVRSSGDARIYTPL